MELNELKAIMAASLLGGRWISSGDIPHSAITDDMIFLAVRYSQKIWDEVLKQDRVD